MSKLARRMGTDLEYMIQHENEMIWIENEYNRYRMRQERLKLHKSKNNKKK